MAARVRIHPLLQDLTHGQEIVEVEGKNVGECLADLEKKFPGIGKFIFERKGRLLQQVEIFVNGKTTSPNELAALVKEGDELSILILLAGG